MTIFVLAPYGSMSPEVGVIYLLALYLRNKGNNVEQLRCNGLLTLCDRDGESNWRRSLDNCFSCIHEQRALQNWGGIASRDLSRLLPLADMTEISQWSSLTNLQEEQGFVFQQTDLNEGVNYSFRQRFAGADFDLKNKQHERFMRGLLAGAAKMLVAGSRLLKEGSPKALLVAEQDSFLVRGFISDPAWNSIPKLSFLADVSRRAVRITQLGSDLCFDCPMIMEDIVSQRNDPKTWPKELVAILEGACSYFPDSIG